MVKDIRDSSEEAMYFGGLMEDMNGKFDAILEATKDIPKIREDLNRVLSWEEKLDHIEPLKKGMQRVLGWEENINLIPTIFEEVGSLRRDVDVLKEAMKLLDRHDARIESIEQRLQTLEQQAHV